MKAVSPKNKKLRKQFPFIDEIINLDLEPSYCPVHKHHAKVDKLSVKVQKADGDLMYRQAYNAGLGDGSYIFSMERKGEIKRQCEYLFALDANNQIILKLNWPRNRDEESKHRPVYGYQALWAKDNGNGVLSDPIYDRVECLVWVTVSAWHKKNQDPGSDFSDAVFAELVERSIDLTVYQKPDCGFDELSQKASLEENLRLNSDNLMRGFLDKDERLIAISGRLDELCTQFRDEVYHNGMKEIADTETTIGGSGQLGPVKVMVGGLCGYTRVTLEDSVSFLSLQIRPGSDWMYVLGQNGTLPQLRNLVRTIVKIWNTQPELRSAFKSGTTYVL